MELLDGFQAGKTIDVDFPQKVEKKVFEEDFILNDVLKHRDYVDYLRADVALIHLIEELT